MLISSKPSWKKEGDEKREGKVVEAKGSPPSSVSLLGMFASLEHLLSKIGVRWEEYVDDTIGRR